MKRTKMVGKLFHYIHSHLHLDVELIDIEEIIKFLENSGMEPPKIKVIDVRGADYPFGVGCSMRCDCEDCNPNFLINKWDKE